MKKNFYFVYPYMIALLAFAAVLFNGAGLIAYLSTRSWLLFLLPAALFPFTLLIEWLEGYKMLGWVTLNEECISLHAPLRKTLTLRWEDVRHAGFGGSSTEVVAFDWVYLRTEPLPLRYQHRMHRLPCTPKSIRFQYREDLFQAILPHLHKQPRAMLQAGKRHMDDRQASRP